MAKGQNEIDAVAKTRLLVVQAKLNQNQTSHDVTFLPLNPFLTIVFRGVKMAKQIEKVVLRRIGVVSLAKVYAVIMAIIGLVYGIFFAVLATVLGSAIGFAGIGAGIGVLAIVAFPIMFAILGFIFGAISAFLYNVIAGRVGGVMLEFEQ